jgi:hypothetical protein
MQGILVTPTFENNQFVCINSSGEPLNMMATGNICYVLGLYDAVNLPDENPVKLSVDNSMRI